MAVPYHTHEFFVPTATTEEAEARSRTDVLISPASLPPAATPSQGLKADSAVQPETLPLVPFTPEGGELTTVGAILDKTSALQYGQYDIRKFGPVTFGTSITENQAIKNSNAINAAIQEAGDAGGGEVVIPTQMIVGYGGQTDDYDWCIHLDRDKVKLAGRSRGSSGLTIYGDDGTLGLLNLHVGAVDNGNADLSRVTVRDLTLNGNYTGSVSGSSLIASEGLQFCNFENLELLNSSGYFFGLQNGGYINNTFRNIIGIGCQRDGFDVKDNGSISTGNAIDNMLLRECGRGTDPDDPWACLDLLGIGWRVSNVDILVGGGGSTAAAVRFKQGVMETSRGPSPSYSTINNLILRYAAGGSSIPCRGIHAKGPYLTIGSGCSIRGFTNAGIVCEQPFVNIGAVQINGENAGGDGIIFTTKTSSDQEFAGADDCAAIGAVVRNCNRGIVSNRVRSKLIANSIDACALGIAQTGATGNSMRAYFNEITNCTAPVLFNSTSSNRLFGNEGFDNPRVINTISGGAVVQQSFVGPTRVDIGVGSSGSEVTVMRFGDPATGQAVRVYGAGTAGGEPRISAVGTNKSLELDTESGAPIINRDPARLPSFAATSISSAANALNTVGKSAGNVVWDTTNNRLMVASGSAANSPWYVSDGSASITPA